jgi:hypothetical protein
MSDTHRIEVLPLSGLASDPGNVRKHDERSTAGIAASLRRYGPARSLVVDGGGTVRAGNGTLDAAAREGLTEVLVITPGPGQLVAVRRPDWSEAEAVGYSIADNRLQELSAFDTIGLATAVRALESDPDFDGPAIGFTGDEVSGLIENLGDAFLEHAGPAADRPPGDNMPPGDGDRPDVKPPVKTFSVVVACRTEAHQRKTFEQLRSEGHRAMMASGYRPAKAAKAKAARKPRKSRKGS